jgi:hypothetical protein
VALFIDPQRQRGSYDKMGAVSNPHASFLIMRNGVLVKVGRNDSCPCGSGKKYKKCCLLLAERIQKALGTTDTIISFRVADLVFVKNLTEMSRALELCVSKKYFNSALKLVYSTIDNLAYLGTSRLTVNKPDFIKWVNTFLLPNSNLYCTGEELYAQRCGLLHQNTVATSNLSSGTKSIFYTWGTAHPEKLLEHVDESRRDECKFVSINLLQIAVYQGMLRFLEVVSKNSSLKESVLKRAQKYFVNIDDKAI